VRSDLNDPSAAQYRDAIGIAHSRYPVGNENGGAAPHQVAQMVENFILGMCVHTGEGIVENEDPWVAYDGARNSGALLLASRQCNTALAHHGLVLFGKTFDVCRDVGGLRGLSNLFIAGVVSAEGDVLL